MIFFSLCWIRKHVEFIKKYIRKHYFDLFIYIFTKIQRWTFPITLHFVLYFFHKNVKFFPQNPDVRNIILNRIAWRSRLSQLLLNARSSGSRWDDEHGWPATTTTTTTTTTTSTSPISRALHTHKHFTTRTPHGPRSNRFVNTIFVFVLQVFVWFCFVLFSNLNSICATNFETQNSVVKLITFLIFWITQWKIVNGSTTLLQSQTEWSQ